MSRESFLSHIAMIKSAVNNGTGQANAWSEKAAGAEPKKIGPISYTSIPEGAKPFVADLSKATKKVPVVNTNPSKEEMDSAVAKFVDAISNDRISEDDIVNSIESVSPEFYNALKWTAAWHPFNFKDAKKAFKKNHQSSPTATKDMISGAFGESANGEFNKMLYAMGTNALHRAELRAAMGGASSANSVAKK